MCEIDAETGAQIGFVNHLGLESKAGNSWQMVGADGVAVALADFEGNECTRIGYAPRFEREALAFFAEIADIEQASNRAKMGRIEIPA